MEKHNKLHEEVLSCLPTELIDMVLKFNPYIEPFEKFKQDIIQTLINEMKYFDNDLDEGRFIDEMDTQLNHHYNTDYMEIVREKELDKILENNMDRLLEMIQYIVDYNDNHGYDMNLIIYEKFKIVNQYRYCYAQENIPTYEDYLEYKKKQNS